jgi:glutamate racemase
LANAFEGWFEVNGLVANSPLKVGIFDSGVGGLSVWREIRRELPNAELVYVADTAHAPYGDRSAAYITERCLHIRDFLLAQDVNAIVIACNTASVHSAAAIRARCPVPVIAIEPAIKPASITSQSKVIAVLATSQTLASENVAKLVATYGDSVKILLQACPGLVEHIERGDISSDALRLKLSTFIAPLLDQGADTIVLGCTHYPFLMPLLMQLTGAKVSLMDPAPAVARELVRRLGTNKGQTTSSEMGYGEAYQSSALGGETFYSSAANAALKTVIERLLNRTVELKALATEVSSILR